MRITLFSLPARLSLLDVPAVHAGILLIAFVLASLLNLGSVALLLVATIAMDVHWARSRKGRGVGQAIIIGLRWNAQTIAVLSVAVAISLSLAYSVQGVSTAPASVVTAVVTVLRGIVSLIAKCKVLVDFAHTVRIGHDRDPHPAPTGELSLQERGAAIVIALAICLSILTPMLPGVSPDTFVQSLLHEMVPRLP